VPYFTPRAKPLVLTTRCAQIDSSNGFIQAVEPEQINLNSEKSLLSNVSFPDTPRHAAEKKKLLERLQRRPDDKWTSSHARHRLLDALYAYKKYYPRQIEELDRLKSLYDKATGPQRKVSNTTIPIPLKPAKGHLQGCTSSFWKSKSTTQANSPRQTNSSNATKSSATASSTTRWTSTKCPARSWIST
jgi:hypothetical protein